MVYINIRSRNKASPFFNRSLDLIRFKSEKDLSQSAEENERDVECLCAIFENVRNVDYVFSVFSFFGTKSFYEKKA